VLRLPGTEGICRIATGSTERGTHTEIRSVTADFRDTRRKPRLPVAEEAQPSQRVPLRPSYLKKLSEELLVGYVTANRRSFRPGYWLARQD